MLFSRETYLKHLHQKNWIIIWYNFHASESYFSHISPLFQTELHPYAQSRTAKYKLLFNYTAYYTYLSPIDTQAYTKLPKQKTMSPFFAYFTTGAVFWYKILLLLWKFLIGTVSGSNLWCTVANSSLKNMLYNFGSRQLELSSNHY